MTTTPQDRRSPAPKTTAKPRATKAAAKPDTVTVEVEPEKPELTESERIEAEQEQKELRARYLVDLPSLRPAITFRMRHRNDFQNLLLDAAKSGAFDEDTEGPLVFDETNKADIERLQKLNEFIACIDEWAETIAENPAEYAEWAQGKTHDHFMALFMEYRDALGE